MIPIIGGGSGGVPTELLGAPNGIATLDADGKVPAEQGGSQPWRGARVKLSSNKSGTGPLAWDAADYDLGGWWSAATPQRLTVPAGVSKVRVAFGLVASDNGQINGWPGVYAANGSAKSNGGMPIMATGPWGSGNSAVVEVTAGDYFILNVNYTTTGAAANGITWFSIEAVETTLEIGVPDAGSVSYDSLDADLKSRGIFRGARIKGTTTNVPWGTGYGAYHFNTAEIDTEGLYGIVSGTGNGFVIPPNLGITQCRFSFSIVSNFSYLNYTRINKNGAQFLFIGDTTATVLSTTPWFPTVAGDQWLLEHLSQNSAATHPSLSIFQIEVR